MADNVAKLRIDTREADANIKSAGRELANYFAKVRAGGGTLMELDEGVMECVKAMGELGTQSDTTKGALREMTQAITDLTAQYRQFTDEEKNSPMGQELAKSLRQMTERAGNMRDAMADVSASITNAASDTRRFDQATQGISLVTSGFQTLQGSAKLLGLEMGDNVEVIAKLQAAMAVTNGLTQAQTLLQEQSALMQGVMAVQAKAAALAVELEGNATKGATVAQAAFNAVAKANPYVLLASAVAAVGTALFAFSSKADKATDAIKTNTDAMSAANRMADIWKNTMGGTFSSLMTKYDELKRQWEALKDSHSKTEWIKQNQNALRDLGGAVTDVKSAEDFFNNNTDAVVQSFVRRAQAAARVAQLTELYRKQIELLDKKSQTSADIASDAQHTGRSAKAGDEITDASFRNSRYGSVNQAGKWVFSDQGAKLYSGTDTSSSQAVMKIDVELQANQAEIDKVKGQITNEFSDITVGGGGGNTSLTPAQQAEKSVSAALTKYNDAVELAAKQFEAGNITEAQYKKQLEQGQQRLYDAYGQAYQTYADPKYKEAQQKAADAIVKLGGEVNTATEAQKAAEKAARELEAAQKKLADAQTELANAKASGDLSQIYAAEKKVKSAQTGLTTVQSGGQTGAAPVPVQLTTANLDAFKKHLQEEMATTNLGDPVMKSLEEQMSDATALSTIFGTAIQNGIDTAQFDTSGLMQKLLDGEDIEDSTIQDLIAQINKKLKAAGGIQLTFNAKTGKVSQKNDDDKSLQQLQKATSGLSSVADGLQQMGVKMPDGVTKVVGAIQGLITVIQGVQSIISVFSTSTATAQTAATTGNTAMLTTLNAQIPALMASVNANTVTPSLFANGGVVHAAGGYIVPGHSYSGDRVPAMLNSGETVLNVSQSNQMATTLDNANKLVDNISSLSFVQLVNISEAIKGVVEDIDYVLNNDIPELLQDISDRCQDPLSRFISSIFANGGVVHAAGGYTVPGTNFSGDRVPALLNSGELVLNRAQQGNLASQLEGSGGRSMGTARASVSGEQIWIALNNFTRASGKGELVTW